jgi:hypothetical protein
MEKETKPQVAWHVYEAVQSPLRNRGTVYFDADMDRDQVRRALERDGYREIRLTGGKGARGEY